MAKPLALACVFLLSSVSAHAQVFEDAAKKISDAAVKRSAERTSRNMAEAAERIAKEGKEPVVVKDPNASPESSIGARPIHLGAPEEKLDAKAERRIDEDILSCTGQEIFTGPFQRALKAARRAALMSFLQSGATIEVVYEAADSAFEAQILKEANQFSNTPGQKLGAVMECVIGKRIKDPLQRAFYQCAVKATIEKTSCFQDWMLQ